MILPQQQQYLAKCAISLTSVRLFNNKLAAASNVHCGSSGLHHKCPRKAWRFDLACAAAAAADVLLTTASQRQPKQTFLVKPNQLMVAHFTDGHF